MAKRRDTQRKAGPRTAGAGLEALGTRLPKDLLHRWFMRHPAVSVDDVIAGRGTWNVLEPDPVPAKPGEPEKPPRVVAKKITPAFLEELVWRDDPVAFRWLFLTEQSDLLDDEGAVVVPKGSRWTLFPVQKTLARIKVDCVIEAGAEVGKSRDLVGRALQQAHAVHGSLTLVGCNSQTTRDDLTSMLEYQIRANPIIGGGMKGTKVYRGSYFEIPLENGSRIQLRICGPAGVPFVGAHADLLLGDECSEWRSQACFSLFYRAAKPGAKIFLYSCPSGRRDSAFYGVCSRAKPLLAKQYEGEAPPEETTPIEDEVGFKKFNLSKTQLPPPMWTERRRASLLAKYGGENSAGWQNLVLGKWGSPQYSVFPLSALKPVLSRSIPEYRVVSLAGVDEGRRVRVKIARLSDALRGEPEEIVFDDEFPTLGSPEQAGRELGETVARFFPALEGELFLGGDLGETRDPSEFLFTKIAAGPERVWTDAFRLHAEGVAYPTQEGVLAALDHASGHRFVAALDRGSAGSRVVQSLKGEAFATCALCGKATDLHRRVEGFAFGQVVEVCDPDTGETVTGAERDQAGRAKPIRLQRKEWSTRMLEARVSKRRILIADDGGAGNADLGSVQNLVAHTYAGTTAHGDRRFSGLNDHVVDSRRMVALAIAEAARGGLVVAPPTDPALLGRIEPTSSRLFSSGRDDLDVAELGVGRGIERGFRGDW